MKQGQADQHTGYVVKYDIISTRSIYCYVTDRGGVVQTIRVTRDAGHWTAVELDEFGGFSKRLYDGRVD